MSESSEKSKIKNVKRLLEITQTKKLALQAFTYSIQSYQERDPEIYDILMKKINLDEMVEELFITVYGKHFSAAEIEELIQFYESPLGKKMIRVSPQLFQEVSTLAEQYITEKLSEFLEDRDTSFSFYT